VEKQIYLLFWGQNWEEKNSQSAFALPTAVSQLLEKMKQEP
jgi:hypothetical protein